MFLLDAATLNILASCRTGHSLLCIFVTNTILVYCVGLV